MKKVKWNYNLLRNDLNKYEWNPYETQELTKMATVNHKNSENILYCRTPLAGNV